MALGKLREEHIHGLFTMHSASGRSALKGLTGLQLDAQHMVISIPEIHRNSNSTSLMSHI